jgi:hypothetical protein
MLKAVSVHPGEHYSLYVTYSDGKIAHVDLAPLLEVAVFAPLRDPAFFAGVKIADGGSCLAWNDQLDLDAAALRMPPEQLPSSVTRLLFLGSSEKTA